MKKSVYIIRWGAFGDHIHMSHVLRIFNQEGWNVSFEYNLKGAQLHYCNPWIHHHVMYEPPIDEAAMIREGTDRVNLFLRVKQLREQYDRVINLGGSLEDAMIAPERNSNYFMFKKWRNKRWSDKCYYDQSVDKCGLDKKYHGLTGELYYKKYEHDRVIDYFNDNYKGKFVFIWCLTGSMMQKQIWGWSKDVIDIFHKRHPETVFLLSTAPDLAEKSWENEYTKPLKMPFRQVALMTRYANAVVTPETGLGIIAGAYGTPKMMLLTAASLKNIVGNDKNDFSLQSRAWCSPCHRAIYNSETCQTNKLGLPICNDFDKDEILSQLEKMYLAGCCPDRSKKQEMVYM